jgi:hypothetical protein
MQRESQVRTAIVERVDPIVVADHQDRAALALDHHQTLRLQLVKAGDPHERLVAVGRRGTIENLHSVESNMSGRSDNTPAQAARISGVSGRLTAGVSPGNRHGDDRQPPLSAGARHQILHLRAQGAHRPLRSVSASELLKYLALFESGQ